MPIIFVNWTEGKDDETKDRVAMGITKGICEAADLPPERITVVFNDIPHGSLANAGMIINRLPKEN